MKMYADNILVKSRMFDTHLVNPEETFIIIKEF